MDMTKDSDRTFSSRFLCAGTWIGWAGPGISPDETIPDPDPTDTSPTAGLLSDQVLGFTPLGVDNKDGTKWS